MKAHRAIEIFELHMRKRTDFDGAGIVDQDVDLTETLNRLLDGGLNLRGLEQIALNRKDFGSGAIQLRFRAGEFFGIARLCLRARKSGARSPNQDRASRR